MAQARRLLAGSGIGCSLMLIAGFAVPCFASASSTNYAGALVERLTSSGFAATTTPQPDLAAAQAQEQNLPDQGFAGWEGEGISATSPSDAWAVGSFTDLHGRIRPAIEHFDGTAWHSIPQPQVPTGSFLTSVKALASNDAWAVGARYAPELSRYAVRIFIEHWDGTRWQVVQGIDTVTGDDGAVLDAVSGRSANDLWVAGATCSIARETPCAALFEHWDGHAWSVVAGPRDVGQVTKLSADTPTDAWAMGYVGTDCLSACATGLMHWDGATWTTDTSAVPSGYQINGVAALTPSDVWAVGNKLGPSRNSPLFEHWDGRSWRVVAGPIPGHSAVVMRDVAAATSTDVYAVGSYYVDPCSCHIGQRTFAEHWDGSSWQIVRAQSPQISGDYFSTGDQNQILDWLSSVTAVPGAVFALGNQTVEYD